VRGSLLHLMERAVLSSLIKIPKLADQDSTLITSFNLIPLPKGGRE
jgi:hypothetical protein